MTNNKTRLADLRVLACQHGARRRYAMPRMLDQAGILSAFYTDSSANSTLGRLAVLLGSHAPQAVQRLARRRIDGVAKHKIFSSDRYNLYELGQKLWRAEKKSTELFLQRDRIQSRVMINWGLRGANTIYSMYHENLDFIRWAKAQGARIVLDVYINPMTHSLMRTEFSDFPCWGGCPNRDLIILEEKLWQQAAELADLLLCPSQWVVDGALALAPGAEDKIRIVPYGCSINYGGRVNKPIPGRVFFSGGYPLRKGLRYLAQAASELKESMPHLDFRVAGNMETEVTKHPICKDLTFLGKLSTDAMQEEYLSADCFVLPSLSEGFAGVVVEAISAGCPVIVTAESGIPIIEGREGIVIESRNVTALANAVARMVSDRGLRNSCAHECLEQAPFYAESMWQKRLVKVISDG